MPGSAMLMPETSQPALTLKALLKPNQPQKPSFSPYFPSQTGGLAPFCLEDYSCPPKKFPEDIAVST